MKVNAVVSAVIVTVETPKRRPRTGDAGADRILHSPTTRGGINDLGREERYRFVCKSFVALLSFLKRGYGQASIELFIKERRNRSRHMLLYARP